jgi:D-alanine--poly(phosphoribitol) ligase subunit 2
MAQIRAEVEQAIHAQIVALARTLGNDARGLKRDQLIPHTGWLDSASLMELMLWFENEYDLEIPQEDLNLDNFGTVAAMTDYLARAGKL